MSNEKTSNEKKYMWEKAKLETQLALVKAENKRHKSSLVLINANFTTVTNQNKKLVSENRNFFSDLSAIRTELVVLKVQSANDILMLKVQTEASNRMLKLQHKHQIDMLKQQHQFDMLKQQLKGRKDGDELPQYH